MRRSCARARATTPRNAAGVVAMIPPPHADRRPPAGLPPGWPVYALFVGFPLWWVLGLGSFIWPVLALPMLLSLLRRRHIRLPPGFGIWLVFLGWLAVSATRLGSAERLPAYLYRGLAYVSVTVLYLYVFNASPDRVPARRVIGALTIFWMAVVAGGYLGTFVPRGSITTPLARIVPAGFGDESLDAILRPTFANRGEESNILPGMPVGRPAAPFPYTNAWGANFALLVPFALMSLTVSRSRRWKGLIVGMLVASIVPVVSSLNRGLWLSLTVGLVYAAVRLARNGRPAAFAGVACILVAAAAIVLTVDPINDVFEARLETDHSGRGRLELYLEAIAITMEQPVLGHGAPVESDRDPSKPSVGTHGQFWLVLVSTGVVGAVCFVAWYGVTLRRTLAVARRDPLALWCHVVVAISLAQVLYYEQLPAQLH
ncbi:MAG: O-antigen ligase family protein, partial [Actinomycetota bacterium]